MSRYPLTLGRIHYLLWSAPKNFVRQSFARGWSNTYHMLLARREMQRSASRLRLRPARLDSPYVQYLTGDRFWHETVLCYASLRRATGDRECRLVLHDDGTLSPRLRQKILRCVPDATIVGREEIEQRLEKYLPRQAYPVLRRIRETYPHLRKLTDIHAGRCGWQLVLDSDMLFFSSPVELLEWLDHPTACLVATDIADAYGYEVEELAEICGQRLPSRVNVGVCGLRSEDIPWPRVEAWAATLVGRFGLSYYLEQALTAMIVAGLPHRLLPPSEYIVLPSAEEVRQRTGKLHHYVAESKQLYYGEAWRSVT